MLSGAQYTVDHNTHTVGKDNIKGAYYLGHIHDKSIKEVAVYNQFTLPEKYVPPLKK